MTVLVGCEDPNLQSPWLITPLELGDPLQDFGASLSDGLDPFDDFDEDDFDDDFDDDFEEDWEDDLTEDEEFPDTFGGHEDDDDGDDDDDSDSPFNDDPDFDDD